MGQEQCPTPDPVSLLRSSWCPIYSPISRVKSARGVSLVPLAFLVVCISLCLISDPCQGSPLPRWRSCLPTRPFPPRCELDQIPVSRGPWMPCDRLTSASMPRCLSGAVPRQCLSCAPSSAHKAREPRLPGPGAVGPGSAGGSSSACSVRRGRVPSLPCRAGTVLWRAHTSLAGSPARASSMRRLVLGLMAKRTQ